MMRKFFTVSLTLLLLLFRITFIAFAADAAGADIPVVIEGGGTATMIPEVNCPLPAERSIRVDNGRTGHFNIQFTEPGEYHYTIKAVFSAGGEERAADEEFRLAVTVTAREDGSLYTVSVINGSKSANKQAQVRFSEMPETTTQPPETTTRPPDTSTTVPTTTPKPGTPRTGDESHLTEYLMIATLSAAGLFAMALLYAVNTKKLIKED